MTNTLLNIFISHAWKDKKLSVFKEIENKLRESYNVWIDVRGIDYGEIIRERLVQAIETSDVVLVLWSKAASESEAVQFEIQTALDLEKIVVPCVITDYSLDHSQKLQGRKYIDFMRDAKGIKSGLIRLTQFLISLKMREPEFGELQDLVSAQTDLLQELEHFEYRMQQRVSGNEHGVAYIQSSIKLLNRMTQASRESSSDEKIKMSLFTEGVSRISAQYRNPDQNDIKLHLLVKLIDEIDPEGTYTEIQALKMACLGGWAFGLKTES